MSEQALLGIASATAAAVERALGELLPGAVVAHGCEILPDGSIPADALPAPAVACRASYVDGVTGGTLLAVSVSTARRLAEAVTGHPPDEPDGPLDELELEAAADALARVMGAAALATGAALDMDVAISPPSTREALGRPQLEDLLGHAPNAGIARFAVDGEPCLFAQLMPHSFALRAQQALEDLEGALAPAPAPDPSARSGLQRALAGVDVRVSAELGRAPRALGELVGLPSGSVVELDRDVDDPIDLYVNGARFAVGRLVIGDDGRWAVRIDQILAAPAIA